MVGWTLACPSHPLLRAHLQILPRGTCTLRPHPLLSCCHTHKCTHHLLFPLSHPLLLIPLLEAWRMKTSSSGRYCLSWRSQKSHRYWWRQLAAISSMISSFHWVPTTTSTRLSLALATVSFHWIIKYIMWRFNLFILYFLVIRFFYMFLLYVHSSVSSVTKHATIPGQRRLSLILPSARQPPNSSDECPAPSCQCSSLLRPPVLRSRSAPA